MTMDAPFMEAILANLKDDAPRLVYADRLLERGDARGELIVVQCRRARLEREGKTSGAEFQATISREREILQQHRTAWTLGAPSCELTRGFISRVSLPWTELREKWPHLSQLPLEKITLEPIDNDRSVSLGTIAWLARQPAARRLERIGIGVYRTDGTATFEASLLFATFTDLDDERELWPAKDGLPDARSDRAIRTLRWSWPTPKMVEDIGRRPETLPLEAFVVQQADLLEASDARALISATAIRDVAELELGLLRDAESMVGVLDGPSFPRLSKLTITGSSESYQPNVSEALARSKLVSNLLSLCTDVVFTTAVCAAIDQRSPALTQLELDYKTNGQLPVSALGASPIARRLRALSVTGWPSIKELASGPFDALERLSITRTTIDDEAATLIVRAFPKVELLTCTDCFLQPDAAAILNERWPAIPIGDYRFLETPHAVLRAEPEALQMLAASDHKLWKRLILHMDATDACPPVLLRALLEIDDLEGWIRRGSAAVASLSPDERMGGYFAPKRWISAGIEKYLPRTDPSALGLKYLTELDDGEDDGRSPSERVGEIVHEIEAAGDSEQHRSLLGRTLLLLARRLAEGRSYEQALAAALRAEDIFEALGNASWRADATRMRAGALLRLERIDEALALLDSLQDAKKRG